MTDASVLFVCTGNICRSPTAEGVMRHKLAERRLSERIAVDSAGLGGWHVGDPPDSRAIARAALRGYDLREQRARQFSDSDYHEFDLILGMDRGHMTALERRRPRDGRARLHLFLEFASDRLRQRDVPDPFYGGLADYDRALDLIEPGVEALIEAIERDFL